MLWRSLGAAAARARSPLLVPLAACSPSPPRGAAAGGGAPRGGRRGRRRAPPGRGARRLLAGSAASARPLRRRRPAPRERGAAAARSTGCASEVQESRERVAAAARLRAAPRVPRAARGFAMAAARVIGHDASGLYRTVLIDRGAADGLAPEQAVLTPDGVGRAGRSASTRARRSCCCSPTAPPASTRSCSAPATRGSSRGAAADGCELKYLARQAEVEVGDYVVTSGMGGVFPKGIWIGQVSGVRPGRGALPERRGAARRAASTGSRRSGS